NWELGAGTEDGIKIWDLESKSIVQDLRPEVPPQGKKALDRSFCCRSVYCVGYQFYEGKNKKAKRIASQSDESCSPQAPRQDGLCGVALGFILSEAIVTSACYCIFEDSGLLGKSYRIL
ncbi:hypothetical protein IFM89_033702, partial [Coptis chinensis]